MIREGFEKVKQFAVINPVQFGMVIGWISTLIAVYLRERSWISTVRDLEGALLAVEYDKNRLIDQVKGPEGTDITELCKVVFELLQKSASQSIDAIAKEIPKYLGSSAVLQVIFLLSCMLFEFNLLYSGLNLKAGEKKVNSTLITQTLNFLSRYHPITSVLFGSFVIFKSGFAWIGLLDRNSFVEDMLRWQLSFYLAGLFSYVINNLAGAKKYLPNNWNELREVMKQSSWWLWLASRACGLHNPNLAGTNLFWLVLKTIFAYSFRYFFYYRKQSCAFDERNHVFFINTIVHIWIVFLSAMIFYLPIIILNLNRLQQEYQQTWLVARVRGVVLSVMEYINRRLSDQQTLGLYTFFLMATLAVYVFRFIYFLWTAKCTWYAWLVSWIFIHAHIAIVLISLPGLNFLMQRLKMHKVVRTPFIAKFGEGLLQVNASSKEASKNESANTEIIPPSSSEDIKPAMDDEEANKLGEKYYEETLLSAFLYGIFTDLSSLKEEREQQKQRDLAEGKNESTGSSTDELEDQELYLVFNLVLQADLLAMEEEENTPEDGDNSTSGSPSKEKTTSSEAPNNNRL